MKLVLILIVVLVVLLQWTHSTEEDVKGYHLHVYFFHNNQKQKNYATMLMKYVNREWSDLRTKMTEHESGPHQLPQFFIEIPRDYPHFSDIISWIMLNHGNLSAVLHPQSSEVVENHSVRAFWIGHPLPLDVSKLTSDYSE